MGHNLFWGSLSRMLDLAGKVRRWVSVEAAPAVLLLAGGQKAFQAASLSTDLFLGILLMLGVRGS